MPIPPEVLQRRPEWKRIHGNVLYVPYTETTGFVFRAIKMAEWDAYKILQSLGDPTILDEAMGHILQDCLLWPEQFDLENLSKIDFDTLQQKVEEISPFGSVENFVKTLEQYREQHETVSAMVYAFLLLALPQLSHERIGQFTERELFTHLILAEKILDKPFPIDLKKRAPTPIPPEDVAKLQGQGASERRQQAMSRAKARRAAELTGMSPTPVSSMTTPPKTAVPGTAHGIDFEKEARAISDIWTPDG